MFTDDEDMFHGAPVGVQVWAPESGGENIFKVAKVIDDCLKTWKSKNA